MSQMNCVYDKPDDIKLSLKSQLCDLYVISGEFSVELLRFSENYTFCVLEAVSGRKTVVRVSIPGYHDEEEFLGELIWMKEISQETDIVLPRVIHGRNGEFIQKLKCTNSKKEYCCCMFSFLEGKPLKKLKGEELAYWMGKTGEVLAKLHIQSQNRNSTIEIKRFSWDIEDLLGENARFGNWRDNKSLNAAQVQIIQRAVEKITDRVLLYGKSREKYGLIHADLHCSNIIVDGDTMQIFDYDDCGYGYYLYDFGCSLVEYSDELENMADALIKGYEKIRPLSNEEKAEVGTFILLRRIIRLAWLESHSESDTAKTVCSDYIAKTCRMSEEYVNGYSQLFLIDN